MRKLVPVLLLFFFATLHAPLASAALTDPMPCCAEGGRALCCPINGSGVLKACPAPDRDARPPSLAPFAFPSSIVLVLPSDAANSPVPCDVLPQTGAPALPDPPPRS